MCGIITVSLAYAQVRTSCFPVELHVIEIFVYLQPVIAFLRPPVEVYGRPHPRSDWQYLVHCNISWPVM